MLERLEKALVKEQGGSIAGKRKADEAKKEKEGELAPKLTPKKSKKAVSPKSVAEEAEQQGEDEQVEEEEAKETPAKGKKAAKSKFTVRKVYISIYFCCVPSN